MKKINTSILLAESLGIDHAEMMKFYWTLENVIVAERYLIDASLLIEEQEDESTKSSLYDMSAPLILVIIARFCPDKVGLFETVMGPWSERSWTQQSFIDGKFLESLGFSGPERYWSERDDQFRVKYTGKAYGYDCDLIISPSPQTVGDATPAEQVEKFSAIEDIVEHHTNDWNVFVNDLHNHITTLNYKDELWAFLTITKSCFLEKQKSLDI
jgi:hypothetical protein